jgi:hypothetical protein
VDEVLGMLGDSVEPLADGLRFVLPDGLATLFCPAAALPAPLLIPLVEEPPMLPVPAPVVPVPAPVVPDEAPVAPPALPPPAPPAPWAFETWIEAAAMSPARMPVRMVFCIFNLLLSEKDKGSAPGVVPNPIDAASNGDPDMICAP